MVSWYFVSLRLSGGQHHGIGFAEGGAETCGKEQTADWIKRAESIEEMFDDEFDGMFGRK